MIAAQYRSHIQQLCENYAQGLEHLQDAGLEADGVLLHSGVEHYYHADDRGIAFQAYGHFLHWVSVNQANQFVLVRPDARPIYYQVVPADFWYEQDVENDPVWSEAIDVVRVDSIASLAKLLPAGRFAYCGECTETAKSLSVSQELVNPPALTNFLDYHRAYKTDFEVAQLREANRLALIGHAAAQECFLGGGNEYDIHMSYLNACHVLEDETPYTNIVALDDKSAILHYQNKRRGPAGDSQVLLIDAGYRVRSYGSDITRTTAKESVHPVFAALLQGMDTLEQQLVDEVRPGKSYVDIHLAALEKIAALLCALEICNGSAEQLMQQKIPQLFMPHGVGHLLGINVHDAGGHQQDVAGSIATPPAHSPMLRNTRLMAENMVFTIEPGCYFIPLLLEPQRKSEPGKAINWKLVDQLYPFGGIRIEDNVRVTHDAVENLTRSPA